jgi:hypothetical protein
LIDLRQERLRKSDHLNPLADHADLRTVVGECGFRLERVTYYTPIIGAFVENVLARMVERFMTRRIARALHAADERAHASDSREQTPSHGSGDPSSAGPAGSTASAIARASAKARVRKGGALYIALRALSGVMMLDVWLFGRLQSGPFFALLRKAGPRPQAPGPSEGNESSRHLRSQPPGALGQGPGA